MTQKRIVGDWIPMRVNLARDPAVIQMATTLDVDPVIVVGTLHAFWSWASQQTADGTFSGVTAKWIDNEFRLPGFTESLLAVGWLAVTNARDGCNLHIPHFDYWMSGTAKARLSSRRRVQRWRNARVTRHCYPSGAEEKEKEKENKSSKKNSSAPTKVLELSLPDSLNTGGFRAAWTEWVAYRKQKRAALTQSTVTRQIRMLEKLDHDKAIASIERSIEKGWLGLFEPDQQGPRPRARGASRIASRPGKYD